MNNMGYLRSNREDNELYTPYYAVYPLLNYIPKDKVIWCPFDEEWSAFYNVFKDNGYKVIRSSLSEGCNFFNYNPVGYDVIVSNPPFSIKDQVLKRLYELGKPFAVLLPSNSIQSKVRGPLFTQYGLELLNFHDRICYYKPDNLKHVQKGAPFASSYFCNGVLPTRCEVIPIEKIDEPLMTNMAKRLNPMVYPL